MFQFVEYGVGYLGLLLLNDLEVIPNVFKLFTRSEILYLNLYIIKTIQIKKLITGKCQIPAQFK